MALKNKIASLVVFFIGFNIFSSSVYYMGDGGSGKKVLIYSSQMQNAKTSENYIASVVKDSLKNNLTNYSKLTILDASQTKNLKNVQKKSDDYIETGKIYNAKTFITILTTKNSAGKFQISVSIVNAETGKSEGGYSSPTWYEQDEYLQKAGAEAACNILPLLGVKLTPQGKQMLLGGTVDNDNISITKADLDAINAELVKLENIQKNKAATSEAEYKRAEVQKQILMQQKLNAENTLKQQEEDFKRKQKEAAKNATRDAATKKQLSKMSQDVEAKAKTIRDQKTQGLSPLQKIAVIENEKATLLASNESIQETIRLYNEAMDKECNEKINERKKQPPRKPEVNPKTGELNEYGKKILNADLDKIQLDYLNLKNENTKQVNDSTSETNSQLKSKITSDIRELEGDSYTADSLIDKNVWFMINAYDGDAQGWPINLTFDFAGSTILDCEDYLSYKEVTGEKIPDLQDIAARNHYNTTVENYDNIFSNNNNFIEAVVTYKIKADSKYSSVYNVTVSKIEFFKVTDSQKIKTIKPKGKYAYQYYPITDVDWKTGMRKFSDSTRNLVSNSDSAITTKPSKSQKSSNATKTSPSSSSSSTDSYCSNDLISFDPMNTTTSYFILPTEFSMFDVDDWSGYAYGFSATKSITDFLFYGGNLKLDYMSREVEKGYFYEEESKFLWTLDGMFGANVNFSPALRFSAFVESGIILSGFGIGAGFKAEYHVFEEFSMGFGYSKLKTDYGTASSYTFSFLIRYDPITYYNVISKDMDW